MGKKLENVLVWKIKDEDLKKLDKERYKLNCDFALLEEQIDEKNPSKTTIKRICQRINEIKKRSEGIEKYMSKNNSNFDFIVFRDIRSTVNAIDAYVSYFFKKFKENKAKELNVSRLLRNVLGIPTYSLIEGMVQNYDHELKDRLDRAMADCLCYGYGSDAEDKIMGHVKKSLPKLEKMFRKYTFEMGFPEEINLDLAFTKDEASYYDYGTFYLAISLNEFYCYRNNDNGVKLYTGQIYSALIHETGHALEQKISESMPLGLKYCPKSINRTHDIVAEGVALEMEKLSLPWFEKHKKEFDLSKKDIKIMDLHRRHYIQKNIFQIYHDILEVKEKVEKNLDAHKTLAEKSKLYVFERDPYLLDDREFRLCLDEISYVVGNRHMQNMMTRLRKEYGKRFIKNNIKTIMKGLLLGSWRPKTHEEFFFSEYLPRVKEFFQ